MEWLPELVDCSGNWVQLVERIYPLFKRDFVDSRPVIAGWDLRLREAPFIAGKERDFWHLVTQAGKLETERIPDLDRCARIGWVRAVLDHACDKGMKRWEQTRNGDTNVVVAIPDFSYLVFMGKRNGYLLLLTAYFVASERRRKKYEREYDDFCRNFHENEL